MILRILGRHGRLRSLSAYRYGSSSRHVAWPTDRPSFSNDCSRSKWPAKKHALDTRGARMFERRSRRPRRTGDLSSSTKGGGRAEREG